MLHSAIDLYIEHALYSYYQLIISNTHQLLKRRAPKSPSSGHARLLFSWTWVQNCWCFKTLDRSSYGYICELVVPGLRNIGDGMLVRISSKLSERRMQCLILSTNLPIYPHSLRTCRYFQWFILKKCTNVFRKT